eukprot:SAG11_NODE_68_length_18649_cov_29.058005_15_plen_297_part_00
MEALHVRTVQPRFGTCAPLRTAVAEFCGVVTAHCALCGRNGPEAMMLFLCLAFGAMTAIIAYVRPGGVPLDDITVFERPHPQWLYGLGSFFVVAFCGTLNYTVRVNTYNLWERNAQIQLWMFMGVLYAAGAAFFCGITESRILLGAFILLPMSLLGLGSAYSLWSTNKFVAFSRPDERPVRTAPARPQIRPLLPAAPAPGGQAAMGNTQPSKLARLQRYCAVLNRICCVCLDRCFRVDFTKVPLPLAILRGGGCARDYIMTLSISAVLGSLVGFSAIVAGASRRGFAEAQQSLAKA